MSILVHLADFAGLPVAVFAPASEPAPAVLAAPAEHAWYVGTDYDEDPDFAELWARFRGQVDTTAVTALVIGYWGPPDEKNTTEVVKLLVEAAPAFPALRALFLGDIVMEESDISWIGHGDLAPLLGAYPGLERLEVRGSPEVVVEPLRSEGLRTLRFESGGLPGEAVRAVTGGDLPNLRRLEMWLGTETYGGDSTVADLAPLLSGERFPALRHLGLQNSENQDEIAEAVAGAAVVAQLETLNLGMGTLSDRGAEALLSGQPLTHLKKLDLRHHFLSDAMMERLRTSLDGVEVLLDEKQESDGGWFYIEVSE
ncbi:STM4015 family protein [Actinomadura rupiterrae]|uniref:STM4015 family protein n=1 Tax=Actinomadura rupiterrae TaxID=559627 RepID=UPI0020A37628|nr:STM4015 family protein [Actinomadura rupiterrae]MCP2335677.1 hypothetical protein [Actinomadura rupiterrae]